MMCKVRDVHALPGQDMTTFQNAIDTKKKLEDTWLKCEKRPPKNNKDEVKEKLHKINRKIYYKYKLYKVFNFFI